MITIDLEACSGYPSIDVPHPIDFHESPVSCVKYVHDPRSIMITGLLRRQKKREQSKPWPLDGGLVKEKMATELIITGLNSKSCLFFSEKLKKNNENRFRT